MTAATAAERQRRHRQRARAARYDAWAAELPACWHPFLRAWADRGLRLAPTTGQLQLLRPYAELERGPRTLGNVLARVQRARPRHSPTTYRLVAAVLRALGQLRQLATDARGAFERPLDLSDPHARRERGEGQPGAERPPVRHSVRGSPGQEALGSFADRMRQAGMDPELLERLTRRRRP